MKVERMVYLSVDDLVAMMVDLKVDKMDCARVAVKEPQKVES